MTAHVSGDRLTGALYARWVVVCALAELVGIAAGAAWWVVMDRINPDPVALAGKLAMLVAKSGSGVVEGALLGVLQASVLRRLYPALSIVGFAATTATVAVAGWAAGSAVPIFAAPGTGGAPFEPPLIAVAIFSSGFGGVVGLIFGAAQAVPLSRAAHGWAWWIFANALGWAVALPVIYLAASAPTNTSLTQTVALGVGAGAAAGLTLGAITGGALTRMVPKSPAHTTDFAAGAGA